MLRFPHAPHCATALDRTEREIGSWRACQYRLVSRWDMNRLDAAKFAAVISTFEAIIGSPDTGRISGHRLDQVLSLWGEMVRNLRDLQCEFSVQYAEQVLSQYSSLMGTHEDLRNAVNILQGRFEDELGHKSFYYVEREKAKLYEQANLFGEAVFEQFPSVTFDIEEAAKWVR